MNKKKIKVLVMDVDGTLTDGKIYMGSNGELMKAFDAKDGYAIHKILPLFDIKPVIITGRESKILENRCEELKITEIHQGISDKKRVLQKIMKKYDCDFENVAYIGDDLNDLECMMTLKEKGGFVGCPADAVEEVRKISDFISSREGGNGAVREFTEWIMKIDRKKLL